MIENPMVLHNGYGIRDPQEEEPVPFQDICGSDVFLEDAVLVSPDGEMLLKENAVPYFLYWDFKKEWQVNRMTLERKIENEITILRRLIARYECSEDSESICVVIAYEYGLQALIEIYELSKQKEVMPF